MRLLLSIAAAVSMTGAASAFECERGVSGYLTALDWSVERGDGKWFPLHLTVEHHLGTALKSAWGVGHFSGPLMLDGDSAWSGPFFVENVGPDEVATVMVQSPGFAYLLNSGPGDFDLDLCLRSVIFPDGAMQSFDVQTPSLPLQPIDKDLVDAFQYIDPNMAAGFLIDYTTIVDLDAAPDLAGALSVSGRAIMYMPNAHTILLWPEGSDRIVGGNWYIDQVDGHNELCLVLDNAARPVVCSNLSRDKDILLQSVRGNVFGLAADAPVPFNPGPLLDYAQSLD